MRKLLSCLIILVMLTGCAGKAVVGQAQEVVCNPPPAVVATAKAAAPVILAIISLAVPGSAAYIEAVTAQLTIEKILASSCVGFTELNSLIALLSSGEAEKAKRTMIAVRAVDIKPLANWALTAKAR